MPVTLGERLKTQRTKKRLSLRALAAAAVVPVSTLSALETGARDGAGLTLATATKIAHALDVDLNYLSGFYEEDTTP